MLNQKEILDTLARWLCNSSETCLSCCSYQNKTYLATNLKKTKSAKKSWDALLNLVNDNSLENCLKMFELTATKILALSNKRNFESIKETELMRDFLNNLLSNLQSETVDLSNWLIVHQFALKLFVQIPLLTQKKDQKNYYKILIPWQDLALIFANLFNPYLTEIIQQETIYLESESENEEIFENKLKKTHSEIKIFNHLYTNVTEKVYIGSSKLTCSHCQAIFQIFNNNCWETKGAHNSPELLCKNPRLVKSANKVREVNNLAKQLSFECSSKGEFILQTTSELFAELVDPVESVCQFIQQN